MNITTPLAFPAAGTLSAWWHQLAPHQPFAGWVAHLFCHRVDALVQVARPRPLDPVERLVLGSLSEQRRDAIPPSPLPAPLSRRLVRKLAAAGLVADVAGSWVRTGPGSAALETATVPTVEAERRTLTFVERLDGAQRRVAAPQYMPLAPVAARAWKPADDCAFAIDRIDDAVRQSPEWKAALSFPADIVAGPTPTRDWRHVPTVRPEHFLAILIDTPDPPVSLKAFAIRAETMMPGTTPLFVLPGAARTHLGDFFPTPPRDVRPTAEIELVGDGLVRSIIVK
jgi:hypothetical protein